MAPDVAKRLIWGAIAIAGIVVVSVWPPFRFVSLQAVRQAEEESAFNPKEFARVLWNEKLPSVASTAPSIADVIDALNREAKGAAAKYGTVWGLGGSTYFMLRGVGRVVTVDENGLEVTIDGVATDTRVTLVTDNVFGNTVRNATGLIDPSEFPNSQDLNNVSIALNGIVMNEVLPALRESATVGAELRFIGCTAVRNVNSISELEIVPISVDIVRNEEKQAGILTVFPHGRLVR